MSKTFKNGSVRELWKVSFPMMVTFFSLSAMIFVDRIFLSWYSGKALSASVTAGTLSWAFIVAIMTLAAMSEVFVAQFNGGKKYKEIGKPVWQMLWLCLISFVFFIPAALTIGPMIFPKALHPMEYQYFTFFMYTGPFFCLHSALAGFFIGRGKTKIIQWMAVVGNIVNVVLDPLFIFGIDGVFPSYGMMGAAYATLIGTLVQAGVVFVLFLKKSHHDTYNTRKSAFDRKLFLSCLKIGIPPAAFALIELVGWTTFYLMMRGISDQHIFVASICQSILILFFFVGWGLEKGCVALAGNFIGQKKHHLVNNVLKSSIKLLAIFGVVCGVIFIGFSDLLIDWFFNSPMAQGEFEKPALSGAALAEARGLIKTSLILIVFYIILENTKWALNGLLTAAGDTLFLLVAGTLSLWGLCLLPIYVFIYLPKASIVGAYLIQVVYVILATAVVYARFASGKWKAKTIVDDETVKKAIPVKDEPAFVSTSDERGDEI